MINWISVKERLPDNNKEVIFYLTKIDPYDAITIGLFIYTENVFEDGSGHWYPSKMVSHWAEITDINIPDKE